MLSQGKLEEARAEVAKQQEEAHALLEGNDAVRAEYFQLWEQQRRAPVGMGAHLAGCPGG